MCLRQQLVTSVAITLVALAPHSTMADELPQLSSKASLDMRYRTESVDQDGIEESAIASTLRTRLGYGLSTNNGISFYVDFEDVRPIGSENYNSTSNGQIQYPVIADPADTELNQAYLAYTGLGETTFKYGRQRIKLDNDRFIGNVGWRQNEQTFDAFTILSKPTSNLRIFVGHMTNVNRIFGANHPNPTLADLDMTAELLNVSWSAAGVTITPYAYFLEFDDNPLASHSDVGLRLTGKWTRSTDGGMDISTAIEVEYATQQAYEDGASSIDNDYFHASLAFGFDKLTLKAGHEVLGSNGTTSFGTPLATLHAFNGWADLFLGTPQNGLSDTYLVVGSPVGKVQLKLAYHEYQSDFGNVDYGSEIDFVASTGFAEHYSILLKFAGYSADSFGSDRDKLWLQFGYKY